MKTSIEITLMPLDNNYKKIIKEFIQSLRSMKFKIIETPLSTQIYGDFDLIMSSLLTEIKTTFEKAEGIMINLKIVKGDRFNYKANF
mgnify:FL=1|tara:strand:- start:66 stop:326 length:261 start_codon:yes stop_codon:yes gene_type:complete